MNIRCVVQEYIWITYAGDLWNSTGTSSFPCDFIHLVDIVDVLLTLEPTISMESHTLTGTLADIKAVCWRFVFIYLHGFNFHKNTPQSGVTDLLHAQMIQDISDVEDTYPLSHYAIDAVLVLAQAINNTPTERDNTSLDWSLCHAGDAELVSSSSCLLQHTLMNINIQGLTVRYKLFPFIDVLGLSLP